MSDFSKSVIYKLYCKDITVLEFYIGSTHDEIERERLHKGNCNNENSVKYNYKVYKFIRENGDWENWKFEVIEEFPCENKIELVIQEQYYYDLLTPSLNTKKPYIPEEEREEEKRIRDAKYRKEKQEEIKIYRTKYKKDNREKIFKKFMCECGIEYTHDHRARHCDSKRHKKFILNRIS